MVARGATRPLLSAKQIVFACILLVFVSVVAFSAGMIVGRDYAPGAAGAAATAADGAPLLIVGEPGNEPTSDELRDVTYPGRLGADGPADDTLRGLPPPAGVFGAASETVEAADPDPGQESADAPEPAADAATEVPAEVAAPGDPPPDAGSESYTVQVAALRTAPAARTLAERLVARGFPAYVVPPPPEGPFALYRVRVGRYAGLTEAEAVREQLQREEQLAAWITRGS